MQILVSLYLVQYNRVSNVTLKKSTYKSTLDPLGAKKSSRNSNFLYGLNVISSSLISFHIKLCVGLQVVQLYFFHHATMTLFCLDLQSPIAIDLTL